MGQSAAADVLDLLICACLEMERIALGRLVGSLRCRSAARAARGRVGGLDRRGVSVSGPDVSVPATTSRRHSAEAVLVCEDDGLDAVA